MGKSSSIEWTDHTFNPWWGCVKVSPGCVHCYAETWAKRYGNNIWGNKMPRKIFGESHWREPLKWNEQALRENRRMRVFCASMADVFEDNSTIEPERQKLWKLIESTPNLDWLLLTKRPENMQLFAPWKTQWPFNVWAMTSVENQAMVNQRLPYITQVPAHVIGLSIEPLIGPVNLSPWLDKVKWVIVGGESGPGARPMHPSWVIKVHEDCAKAGVAFFFKQWGQFLPSINEVDESIPCSTFMINVGKKKAGRQLNGTTWNQFPIITNSLSIQMR